MAEPAGLEAGVVWADDRDFEPPWSPVQRSSETALIEELAVAGRFDPDEAEGASIEIAARAVSAVRIEGC